MSAPSASVLYDAPGPVTRRRTLLTSVLVGLVLLAVVALVALRLADQGQLAAARWSPLINPSDPTFPLVWQRLGVGLRNTLIAAILAVVLSLAVGTLLAVTRISSTRVYRWLVVGFIEVLRGVPVVLSIFFAARVLPELGVDLPVLWYLVIGLTAYNSVVIAEIIRAGVASLPRGQTEAAYAIGLTRGQALRLVLLPQAFRVMLPALISQLVVVLKDTSLGFIISYEETVRVAGQIVQNLNNPIQTYLVVAIIFIVVNYALGKLAEYVERRLSHRGAGRPEAAGGVRAGGGVGAVGAAGGLAAAGGSEDAGPVGAVGAGTTTTGTGGGA